MVCQCEGDNYNKFLAGILGECAYNASQEASIFFGYWSLFSWIICYYPQVRMNFIMKSAQAVSLGFAISWLIADTFNIISGALLQAILTQQIIFVYWMIMDIIMLFQFYIYRKNQSLTFLVPTNYGKFEILIYIFLIVFIATNLIWSGEYNAQLLKIGGDYGYCASSESVDQSSAEYIVGTVFAYLSIPVTMASRVFQIYKNYKRKTVKGLSLALFISSLSGNISQMISNLIYDPNNKDYIIQKLPFIIGPIFPVCFDFFILGQYVYYSKRSKKQSDDIAFEEQGLIVTQ